jgi:hypothetical protein
MIAAEWHTFLAGEKGRELYGRPGRSFAVFVPSLGIPRGKAAFYRTLLRILPHIAVTFNR